MDGRSRPSGTGAHGAVGPAKVTVPTPRRNRNYRARPLNGVWATAPYLHNGSVPSLYWMLKPAAERPETILHGRARLRSGAGRLSRVAGETGACKNGETLFSTTGDDGKPINGNSVLGHSLEGTPGKDNPGVIGRLLTKDERYDLIEYLKTL